VTLYTSDYFSYYLTLVGWIINDGLWNVLVASGVVALPFIVIVLQEWLRARTEGADEGNKGVLSAIRIENRVWAAIVVILFAGMPMIPINLSTIQFDRSRSEQCQVNVPLPSQTGWQPAFTTLNNQTALVPIWWFFVHAISQAITEAAVASIPCGTDLRQIQMDIATTRIADPLLAQEVVDFTRDCYGPARAKLFMSRPHLTDAQMYDVSWIGSQYFQTTPGYYDSFHSSTPRTGWPYDPTRDAGLPQVPSGAGYPTCEQWWADPSVGLRPRLLQQVSPNLLTQLAHWAGFLTQDQVDDSVIRAIISPRQQIMNQGQVYTDYGGQIDKTLPDVATRLASDVGISMGTLTFVPTMDVVRQALPLVLSLLKMAVTICLPLILVIGTFELKTVVTVSCVEFALFFTDFWFQLARWIDSTILDALYGWNSPHANFDPLMGLNNTFGDILLDFVLGMMFLVLPALWVTALAWTGIRAGNFLEGLSDGTRAAGQAGAQGVNTATRIAAK
jgi:hypothetical protein